MSLPLLRKEVREHGPVLAVTLAIAAAALFAYLQIAEQGGRRFTGFVSYQLTIVPLLVLVLAHRLIVREYGGRTQLFLETLPIGRARVFVVKWLLGAGFVLLTQWLAWLATLRSVRETEVLASADARGPLVCAAVFGVTVWSFAVLAAMLGRYRYIAWGALATATLLAVTVSNLQFFDLPVISLLGQGTQMAVALPATSAFAYALAITAACVVGAAVLALSGSGAMASTLARQMTARERVFAFVAFLAVSTIAYSLEPKPEKPPFQITQGERVEGRAVSAGVLPTGTFDASAARALAQSIADDVDGLIDVLALDVRRPVFILPQHGVDRYALQRAPLPDADGIVIRMAPDSPSAQVRMFVAHSLLSDATLGRAMKDDRHALLDGLSAFWALRDDERGRELWWLRAAAVAEPLPAERLTAWAATEEHFGECQSLALAFSVFDTLVQRVGRDAVLESMRAIFVTPPDDVRASFERSPEAALRAIGVDWNSLASDAETARAAARVRYADALARRPNVVAAVDWSDSPERGIAIETHVSGVPRYAAYYAVLGPWTADVGSMPRLDVLGSSAVLPLSPPQGSRVLTVLEVDDEILDCPVRVFAERVDLR